MCKKARWSFTLCAMFIIMLTACSFGNNSTIKENNGMPSFPAQEKIPLLEAIDATNLHYAEPYDENTIYLIASKKKENLSEREFVYAICSLNTGSFFPIHREVVPSDGMENIDLYQESEYKTKFFTGQQLLTLINDNVININNIINTERGVSLNLQNETMAYIDKEPPSILYKSINEKNGHEIIKSKEIEVNGKKAVLFPYIVRLNREGDKILYGTAIDMAGVYQTVCICSTDGTLLAETNQLNINADYLDVLWCGDGFITIETTDSYPSSPTGLATILTKYNKSAEKVNQTVLYGFSPSYQRKFFPNMSLFAFSYQTGSTNGLALWDAETGDAYYVCDEEEYILSPTITPKGEKLLWLHDGSMYIETIDLSRYEKIPTY